MNLSIMTKNQAADSEIGFLTKSISNLNGYAMVMPTAWELKYLNYPVRSCKILFINYRLKSMTIRYFRISISDMKSII